jgi:hypothetical protein
MISVGNFTFIGLIVMSVLLWYFGVLEHETSEVLFEHWYSLLPTLVGVFIDTVIDHFKVKREDKEDR